MMIETSLEYELAGRVDLRFEPNGVECDIAVPLSQVIETEDGEGEKPEGKAVPVRDPLRVLIVEDSVVTAYDFASRLTEWGFTVTGMTGRVSEALTVAEQEFLDLAILDINLGDHDSFPVADRLREKGVPFFFVTGYSAEAALPRRFTDVLCLSKPVSDSTLADAVARATG